MVLYIQITVRVIVKCNLNKKPAHLLRAGCPYKIQSAAICIPTHYFTLTYIGIYIYIYIYSYYVRVIQYLRSPHFDTILLVLFISFISNLLMSIISPSIIVVT